MTTLHDFGGVLGRPLDTFFWALTISCHGFWVICEVALMFHNPGAILVDSYSRDKTNATRNVVLSV